mgnify:CR=1 FL=1
MDKDKTITWEDFDKVDIRIGTIIEVEPFLGVKKPAYKMHIDFGDLGIKKTSAQLTKLYQPNDLIGKQILAVTNFPKKQIKNIMSECRVLGVTNNLGEVVVAETERRMPNGMRID